MFTNDYSRKPQKNPRIFSPKSRGNPRHFRKISGNFRKFRKISEVIPGKSSILEMSTRDYSLKTRKNPRIFPPKSGEIPGNPGNSGNSRNSGNSGNFRKYRNPRNSSTRLCKAPGSYQYTTVSDSTHLVSVVIHLRGSMLLTTRLQVVNFNT